MINFLLASYKNLYFFSKLKYQVEEKDFAVPIEDTAQENNDLFTV